MIESLRIEHLATFPAAELQFSPRFTVITGETGAGKTMLMTSLNWLLGSKTEATLVSADAPAAVVEGTFLVDKEAIAVVEEAGGAVEDNVVEAARVVPKSTRSRSHLGGRTVPAATLTLLGEQLVTVHGQATQGRLRGEKAQREALDAFGNPQHQAASAAYRASWEAWNLAKSEYVRWKETTAEREHRRETLLRLVEDFQKLKPRDGEYLSLTSTITRLSNVESLRENVCAALSALDQESDSTPGATESLNLALRALERAARSDPNLENLVSSLSDIGYVLSDAVSEIGIYLQDLNADPQILQDALSRRNALKDLSLRAGVDADKLGTAHEEAQAELANLQDNQGNLQKLETALLAAKESLAEASRTLHLQRKRTAKTLSKAINEEMRGLDMAQSRVEISVEAQQPSAHGPDKIQFLLQPHPSSPLLDLGAAASGGELSRIMLALEVALASNTSPEESLSRRTLVFDEVDAGIGGQAGIEVGRRLARLSTDFQVIVVTHLAQVAAFADTQIQVRKIKGESRVEVLDARSRPEELARMISGNKLTPAALRHADELLELAAVGQSES